MEDDIENAGGDVAKVDGDRLVKVVAKAVERIINKDDEKDRIGRVFYSP